MQTFPAGSRGERTGGGGSEAGTAPGDVHHVHRLEVVHGGGGRAVHRHADVPQHVVAEVHPCGAPARSLGLGLGGVKTFRSRDLRRAGNWSNGPRRCLGGREGSGPLPPDAWQNQPSLTPGLKK